MNYGSAEAEVLAGILVLGTGHCKVGIVFRLLPVCFLASNDRRLEEICS